MTNTKEICQYLSQFITEQRLNLFNKVLEQRTRYLSVALEDIYQAQNASAVLRTADCFGIQDVHIIENQNEYQLNPDVALGSSKWINMHKYNEHENNTLATIQHLKKQGYRIVATSPHRNDVDLENFDLSKGKSVFFFGTEKEGLSDLVLDNADEYVKIPMHGFTESFNISVSAAIILHHLTHKLRKSDINWQLDDTEKDEILFQWIKGTVKNSEMLIKRFHEES